MDIFQQLMKSYLSEMTEIPKLKILELSQSFEMQKFNEHRELNLELHSQEYGMLGKFIADHVVTAAPKFTQVVEEETFISLTFAISMAKMAVHQASRVFKLNI